MDAVVIDVVKLLGVFFIIITVMWLGKTLMLAMVVTSVGTILLYQIPADVAWRTVWKGATSWTTIQPLLVFYTITFLQRMMEKRKDLSNCQIAMNGLFNNRRINVSVVPFFTWMPTGGKYSFNLWAYCTGQRRELSSGR